MSRPKREAGQMDKHDAVFAGSLCQDKHYKTFNHVKHDIKWKISYRYFLWKPTFKWGFPPVSISDFHMVVPTQVTPVQIHGGEVEDNLGKKTKQTTTKKTRVSERLRPKVADSSLSDTWEGNCVQEQACLDVDFPQVHTFSPGVTEILQIQCM